MVVRPRRFDSIPDSSPFAETWIPCRWTVWWRKQILKNRNREKTRRKKRDMGKKREKRNFNDVSFRLSSDDFMPISSEYYAHYYFLPIDRMSIIQYQSLRLLRLTIFQYSHTVMYFYSKYTRNIKYNTHKRTILFYRISLSYNI